MTTTRRGFITATAALFCAPAIVRASSLMPVRSRGALPVVTVDASRLAAPLPDMDEICWRLFIKSNQRYHDRMAQLDGEFFS